MRARERGAENPHARLGACYNWLVVKNRRSLRPPAPLVGDTPASRRGGARHGVSMRVTLKLRSGDVLHGWALNVSRGGVRVMLEERVELGAQFEVTLSTGADPVTSCPGRVVWVQEEPDGVVCGIELTE
jgi:PilZ domain-containing protein